MKQCEYRRYWKKKNETENKNIEIGFNAHEGGRETLFQCPINFLELSLVLFVLMPKAKYDRLPDTAAAIPYGKLHILLIRKTASQYTKNATLGPLTTFRFNGI